MAAAAVIFICICMHLFQSPATAVSMALSSIQDGQTRQWIVSMDEELTTCSNENPSRFRNRLMSLPMVIPWTKLSPSRSLGNLSTREAGDELRVIWNRETNKVTGIPAVDA